MNKLSNVFFPFFSFLGFFLPSNQRQQRFPTLENRLVGFYNIPVEAGRAQTSYMRISGGGSKEKIFSEFSDNILYVNKIFTSVFLKAN